MGEVSEKKSMVDAEKADALAGMGHVIEDLNGQIKHKKDKLAPEIKELRRVRAAFQTVEAEYQDKKGAYDGVRVQIENDVGQVAQEVSSLESELSKQQHLFYGLGVEVTATEALRARATKE